MVVHVVFCRSTHRSPARGSEARAASYRNMHLYLLQKSSGIITAAVYSNFFAPKQHALDGGTRSTAARSKAARSLAACSTAVCAVRSTAVRSTSVRSTATRSTAACASLVRSAAAHSRSTARERPARVRSSGRRRRARRGTRTTMVRSTAVRSTAARSTAAQAQRRRTLNGGTLKPRQRHCCRRMEFFSCFTELLQITVVTPYSTPP